MTFHKITRQIQLKTLAQTTTTNPYQIAESLSGVVGGCVIWTCYDRETLKPFHYHMMGGRGNAPMPDLSRFAQPIKKKKNGAKEVRHGYRSVRIRDAEHQKLSLERLAEILFDESALEAK